MSIKIMTRVWEYSKMKGSPLLLLLALADNSNDEGVSWYGLTKLSKKIRLTRRQTINLAHSLDTTRELYIAREKGPHGTNLYFVTTEMKEPDLTVSLVNHLKLDKAEAAALASQILGRGEKIALVKKVRVKNFTRSVIPENDPSFNTQDHLPGANAPAPTGPSNNGSGGTKTEPETPPTPSKKTRKRKPEVPPPGEGVLDAICLFCYGTPEAFGLNASSIVKLYNDIGAAGEPPTIETLRKVYSWWKKQDWRGKKGQRPTPSQLKQVWATAIAYKEGNYEQRSAERELLGNGSPSSNGGFKRNNIPKA